MVLDMSKAFYAGIGEIFGDAVQVIDRFHGTSEDWHSSSTLSMLGIR
ncbi:MAG: hypothetical protein ETSY2_34815 [Candidatus Entotheonella gemina]|uniref:Transposase IS204/IS1001/IS1096/IS1165 DDE domain-containing protein n=1 Tax=Candidatus Entotheonella gemina TaxID=1429439 RepID=W4LY00_9BACT|nr:MAG: hypothetical protein ETSY2_34815 [Candidatus Entotheonella gemina]